MRGARVLAYCQAKSISVPGTKNEPGSEAIRDKNLVRRESAARNEDADTLAPLVSENTVMRDLLVFPRIKEFAAQPAQIIEFIGERRLSQNGSDKVNGEGFIIAVCAHEFVDSRGQQVPSRNSTNALTTGRTDHSLGR